MGSRTLFAAALTLIASGLLLLEATQWAGSARFGPIVGPNGSCSVRVLSVDPAASKGGLRAGDLVDLRAMNENARSYIVYGFARLHAAPFGSRMNLAVIRGGARIVTPYDFGHDNGFITFLAQLGFKIVILAIGLVVLWRGHDASATWLGAWCTGIALALPDAWWGALPDTVRTTAIVLTNLAWTTLPFALYMVIETFITGLPRYATWIARATIAISLAPSLFNNVINAGEQTATGCVLLPLNPTMVNALFAATQFVILAYFIIGYAGTAPAGRMRLRWVFWAFVFSRIGVLVNLLNRVTPHPMQLSGIEWLTIVFFPLGCAYAILRHRIIDVNFVLNRTLIYTTLTTIVVGVFVLLETFVSKLAVGHGIGLTMEVIVALGIGVSFNALHHRVEQLMDRTFFRGKYEAAKQLAQLAEAAFVEKREALLERAATVIPSAMGAWGAAVYERHGEGYRLAINTLPHALPEIVDADDEAFVRLRTRLTQVDLADVKSALGSDAIAWAFSMRGAMTGAFLCGRRRNGETFAPDEIVAVRSVVHEIGLELSAIRARYQSELLADIVAGRTDVSAASAMIS